jgi:hypothetical protein
VLAFHAILTGNYLTDLLKELYISSFRASTFIELLKTEREGNTLDLNVGSCLPVDTVKTSRRF